MPHKLLASCLPVTWPVRKTVPIRPGRRQTYTGCCGRLFSSWEHRNPRHWHYSPDKFPNRRCSSPGSLRSLPLATHPRRTPVCGSWHRWQSGRSHPAGGIVVPVSGECHYGTLSAGVEVFVAVGLPCIRCLLVAGRCGQDEIVQILYFI